MNLLKRLKLPGKKIQKPSTSPSTPRVGGMIVVVGTWKCIGLQRGWRIGNNSEVQSRI